MSEKEREIGRTLADAFAALPPEKKERLLGYAEGVADQPWGQYILVCDQQAERQARAGAVSPV